MNANSLAKQGGHLALAGIGAILTIPAGMVEGTLLLLGIVSGSAAASRFDFPLTSAMAGFTMRQFNLATQSNEELSQPTTKTNVNLQTDAQQTNAAAATKQQEKSNHAAQVETPYYTQGAPAPIRNTEPIHRITAKELSKETKNIIDKYQEFRQKNNYQKENIPLPSVNNDKSVAMSFKTKEDTALFCRELAKSGASFVIRDKDQNILAYSKNGQLYNPNTKEPYGEKDILTAVTPENKLAAEKEIASLNTPQQTESKRDEERQNEEEYDDNTDVCLQEINPTPTLLTPETMTPSADKQSSSEESQVAEEPEESSIARPG